MNTYAHYWRNANQNYHEISFTQVIMAIIRKSKTINAGEGVEKRECSYNAGGDVN